MANLHKLLGLGLLLILAGCCSLAGAAPQATSSKSPATPRQGPVLNHIEVESDMKPVGLRAESLVTDCLGPAGRKMLRVWRLVAVQGKAKIDLRSENFRLQWHPEWGHAITKREAVVEREIVD